MKIYILEYQHFDNNQFMGCFDSPNLVLENISKSDVPVGQIEVKVATLNMNSQTIYKDHYGNVRYYWFRSMDFDHTKEKFIIEQMETVND